MKIITNDFKEALFQGEIRECQKKEKLVAAVKKLITFWGLALISIFIPVLHFVLVPLFILVGIGFFFVQFQKTHLIHRLSFKCPDCDQENRIEKMYFKETVRFRCEACSAQLILN